MDRDGEGGESACFAHLLCPDCGVVLDEGDHAATCAWVDRSALTFPGA
jgi:hypothetical protein